MGADCLENGILRERGGELLTQSQVQDLKTKLRSYEYLPNYVNAT